MPINANILLLSEGKVELPIVSRMKETNVPNEMIKIREGTQ